MAVNGLIVSTVMAPPVPDAAAVRHPLSGLLSAEETREAYRGFVVDDKVTCTTCRTRFPRTDVYDPTLPGPIVVFPPFGRCSVCVAESPPEYEDKEEPTR